MTFDQLMPQVNGKKALLAKLVLLFLQAVVPKL
jgi:hypothetical protein